MGFHIEIKNLSYGVNGKEQILDDISANILPGQFVSILGENGAGKTSLLDLMMGFKAASKGSILVQGAIPSEDPWQMRAEIAYLSEKVDMPGDWSVEDFLSFNSFFYPKYSKELEKNLCEQFRVNRNSRIGFMSAGEIRRVQIVGALAMQPKLIIVDEITAVLDIVGRRIFMKALAGMNRNLNSTVILATNILEDLDRYTSHILLVKHGSLRLFQSISELEGSDKVSSFSEKIANMLEAE